MEVLLCAWEEKGFHSKMHLESESFIVLKLCKNITGHDCEFVHSERNGWSMKSPINFVIKIQRICV